MITHNQLSLADIFSECQEKFQNDKHGFLELLDQAMNLDEIVPVSFVMHFHALTGRPRKHLLYPMLKSLILQRVFSIPTDVLLIIFLKFSKELRDFCGFSAVPDASKFTRFKQDFLMDLQSMFDNLVDLTEPICQKIDPSLAAMTIFDTSGIEAWVRENNPKYLNSIIRQLTAFKKANGLSDSYDPHKAAYGKMPSHAAANPAIQQMYINGHFCYSYKFGIITNGLGIVRGISFFNRDFLDAHPEIAVGKKTDSPDEDKSLADSKALIPVLKDYFGKHPTIIPRTFIGDAAFDTIQIYHDLFNELHFEKALIPLNGPLSMEGRNPHLNGDGVPCCPKDDSLPMRREGSKTHLRCGLPSMKFVCPKMKWERDRATGKTKRVCHCENPCTDSSCGRMIYIYPEKDLRACPGVARDSDEWVSTYKIRGVVEQSINQFKDSYCLAGRRTRDGKTLHADLLLSGITQLITVLVADKIHSHQHLKSMKRLIA
jgi:hypothetical protein